jgi:hypothetical protein
VGVVKMTLMEELEEIIGVSDLRVTNKRRVVCKDKSQKYCPRCKTVKTVKDFYINRKVHCVSPGSNRKFQAYCKQCELNIAKLRRVKRRMAKR